MSTMSKSSVEQEFYRVFCTATQAGPDVINHLRDLVQKTFRFNGTHDVDQHPSDPDAPAMPWSPHHGKSVKEHRNPGKSYSKCAL